MVTPFSDWSSDDVGPPGGAGAWDLVVVGGGTAGIVAATTAAGLGASVLLLERGRPGGDCLWSGCVPSKSLLAAAHAAADARGAGALGLRVDGVHVDFAAVMAHVHDRIAAVEPDDSPETLRRKGVRVAAGVATFSGKHKIRLETQTGEREIPYRRAVLATGSSPAVPAVPGLDGLRALTTDTVWGLTALPERLLVLGGGAVGCELGQAFARLGSRVTLVEQADRVLPSADPMASECLATALGEDGVVVRAGTTLVGVEAAADTGRDGTYSGAAGAGVLAGGERVEFDALLVAGGRTPRTRDLGLDLAGVELDPDGYVVVDDSLKSSNPDVYAAGDLTGHPAFTHVAGVHGSLAASNAVLGLRRKVDPVVPRVTFTQPEVASVGVLDAGDGNGLTLRTIQHAHVDRAVTERRTAGFTRLVLDRRSRVVGATVVGPRAGESLAELTLAVRQGLRARDLAGATHPYPTYGDGAWDAAIEDVRASLRSPLARIVVRVLLRLRKRVGPGPGG